MALSGTIYGSTVDGGYRLEIDWSGTQSISGNYTDVTAKVYWHSLGSGYTISSSSTKTGTTTIDGSTSSWSVAGAHLSGNERRLLNTYTHRVYHNSDGTKSCSISAVFYCQVTLGSYIDHVGASGTVTLDTIPRASSLTGGQSWTLLNSTTFTISRADSSFTHTIKVEVYDGSAYQTITSITGVATSYTWTPTTSQNTTMLGYLNNDTTNWNQATRITLTTYDGSTTIGSKTYSGTLSSPAASTVTISNPTGVSETSGQENSTVWVDQEIDLSISRANSAITHTVRFKDGNSGNVIHELTGVGTSVAYTFTSAEQDQIYQAIPNSIELDGQIDVIMYYNGTTIRGTQTPDINYRVRNSNPTFTTIGYLDTNTTTTGITGNNQYIIQNHSSFRAQVLAANYAVAQHYATISKYIATINGVSKTLNSPFSGDLNFDFGTLDVAVNQTLTITVYDSRGFSKAVTINVTIIPYQPPVVYTGATRANGFGSDTTITLSGQISRLTVNGVDKNTIDPATQVYYNYTPQGGTVSANYAFSGFTLTMPTYNANDAVVTLDYTQSWTVVVSVSDKLATTNVSLPVGKGQPIFYIDKVMRSIGFGDFPSADNQFLVNGRLVFGANQYAANAAQGETGSGALFLNNSDMTGVNGIFFNDVADNDGEGLLFLKTGATIGSTTNTDYHNFRIDGDGNILFDSHQFAKLDANSNPTFSTMYIENSLDLSLTSTNHGLTIGTWGSYHIAIDGNEIQAINGTTASDLYLNNEGGTVHIQNNLGYSGSSVAMDISNTVQIHSDGGNFLELHGSTHGYIEYYVDGTTNRTGYVGFGSPSSADMHIAQEKAGGALILRGGGGSANFYVDNDGANRIWSTDVYNRTYSYAANMYVTSAGTIGRATSASKYKLDIQPWDDTQGNLLSLTPKSWIDKFATDHYNYWKQKEDAGEAVDWSTIDCPDPNKRYAGFIAEDLVAAGLDEFVVYDETGTEVEGIMYDRLWIPLVPKISNHEQRLQAIEKKLGITA